jgi:glycosyltransferase involved in cell wall biosynthesis
VVLFDDETREIAKEIVRNDALDRVFIATDYFDASINRISAWVTGVRNVSKALLFALLQPNAKLKALQDENNMTELMVLQEELKTAPFGDVWAEFLRREGVDCTLDMLGEEEEDHSAAIRIAEEAGWLRYHGYQNDVRPFVAASHCFVLPSWHEGMANTNLECAAMARPIITSRIHGCMEAVEEGVSGYLCAPGDTDSLCAAMHRFAALSHAEKSAMGDAGRRRMKILFDREHVVDMTMEALEV